jgi:hypothetical protein
MRASGRSSRGNLRRFSRQEVVWQRRDPLPDRGHPRSQSALADGTSLPSASVQAAQLSCVGPAKPSNSLTRVVRQIGARSPGVELDEPDFDEGLPLEGPPWRLSLPGG